jgi:nucleoside-diphosphate-sugar epimerase
LARFLVTGAAGFIGRSIAAELLRRGETVRGIDNFLTGKRENLVGLEEMEFVEGDLIDPFACMRACAGVEIVFHQAALASVPRSVADPVGTNRNCVDTTVNLLEAARAAHVRRVVFAGSSSAYGDTPVQPKHEGMPENPLSPYGVAKLAAEHYVRSFARVYDLETVVLRYFNVFGPYQDPASHYSGVLAIFCRKMLAGERPTIYGDGEQSRDFTYVDNVVHANLLAAEAPAERVSGQVMNTAMGARVTLNETFRILSELTGYRGDPVYAAARAGDIRDSQADIGRATELMGYSPVVDLREGLRRTVEWYRAGSGVAVESFVRRGAAVRQRSRRVGGAVPAVA